MKETVFVITSWLKLRSKIIIAVIGLYLFFLIINFPASIAISLLKLPSNIRSAGVSGTIWKGNIRNLYISGIKLGAFNWKIQPLYLLVGELAADIEVRKNQQYIISGFRLSSSGNVKFENTRFAINLSSLQPLVYGMPFSYGGNASGHFPLAYFEKNKSVAINGKLSLTNVEMLTPQQQAFGGVDIDFRAEEHGMSSARLKGNDDRLAVSGNLIISKDGWLKIFAKLAARYKGSRLENMIAFLGKKDRNGQVHITRHFQLF